MTNFLIPMAGLGKRFADAGYTTPKPLLSMGKETMIEVVIKRVFHKDLHFIFVVNKTQINPKDLAEKVGNITKDFEIIEIDHVPQGSAMSCMKAEKLVNNDSPLFIGDSDMIIEDFNFQKFQEFCDFHSPDGVIGTFFSQSPKNCYIKINEKNEVVEAKEKVVISNISTNGLCYWKHGKYFVDAANKMVADGNTTNNEFYVGPSYAYMFKNGMKVMPYHFNMHFPVGTPEDYENYKKWRNL
jgi:NDP-sugar pyrophosphorylase family protein